MYTFKDQELSEEKVKEIALAKGYTVGELLARNAELTKIEVPDLVGKSNSTDQGESVDVTIQSENTPLESEDGDLKPKKSYFNEDGSFNLDSFEGESRATAARTIAPEKVISKDGYDYKYTVNEDGTGNYFSKKQGSEKWINSSENKTQKGKITEASIASEFGHSDFDKDKYFDILEQNKEINKKNEEIFKHNRDIAINAGLNVEGLDNDKIVKMLKKEQEKLARQNDLSQFAPDKKEYTLRNTGQTKPNSHKEINEDSTFDKIGQYLREQAKDGILGEYLLGEDAKEAKSKDKKGLNTRQLAVSTLVRNDLDIKNKYLYYNQDKSVEFVKENYPDVERFGINPIDFEGFLKEKGYLQDAESIPEGLVKEKALAGYVKMYMNEQDSRSNKRQYLLNIINDKKFAKEFEGKEEEIALDAIDLSFEQTVEKKIAEQQFGYTNFNNKVFSEWFAGNFPILSQRQKERQLKQQEYVAELDGRNNLQGAVYNTANLLPGVATGFFSPIVDFVSWTLDKVGADDTANLMRAEKEEFVRDQDSGGFSNVTGKAVTIDGIEYIKDKNTGAIYNVTAGYNLALSGISADSLKSIDKNIEKNGIETSRTSARGLLDQGGQVLGGLVFQVLLAKGTGAAGKGVSNIGTRLAAKANGFNSVKKYKDMLDLSIAVGGKVPSSLKLPISRPMANSILSQGIYGSITSYESILSEAKLAGLNNDEAQELASSGAVLTGALYAATGPISPKSAWLDKVTNSSLLKNNIKKAIGGYKKGGLAAFNASLKSTLPVIGNFTRKGAAETFQENIQQLGETGVNKLLNGTLEKDILDDMYTWDEFVTTSELSMITGGLLSQMKIPSFKPKPTDRIQNLTSLGEDIETTQSILNNMVIDGVTTQKDASSLMKEVVSLRNQISRMPKWMLNDRTVEAAVLMQDIQDLENQKKELAPAFMVQAEEDIKQKQSELEVIRDEARQELNKNAEKFAEAVTGGKDNVLYVEDDAAAESELKRLEEEGYNADEKLSKGYGSFLIKTDEDGNVVDKKIIINKLANQEDNVATTEQHELLHAFLVDAIRSNPKAIANLGQSLRNELAKIGSKVSGNGNFQKRLQEYLKDTDYDNPAAMEEALTLFSEGLTNGELVFNETISTKIGDLIRRFLSETLGVKVKFNEASDVINFLRDYNKSFETGVLSKGFKNTLEKGAEGDLLSKDLKIKVEGNNIKQETSKKGKESKRIVSPQAIALKDVLSNEELVESIKSPTTEDKFSVAQAIVEKNWPVISKKIDFTPTQQDTAKEVVEEQILGVFQGSGQGKYSARNTGLFNAFDPSVAQVNTYLGKTIGSRKPEIDLAIKERAGVTGQDLSKAEGITVAESTPTPVDTKKIKPSSLLPSDVISKVKKEVKEKLKDVPANKLTFKKLGNLAPDIIAEAIGIPVKKLTDAASNLSKSDASAIQRFISKKPETLIKLLPEGAVLEAATQKLMGTSTGVPKSLLDAFYTKQDRTTDPSGLYPFKLNSNLNRADFLEAFGIIDGKKAKEFSPRSTEAQRLKGIASLFGRLVTNEIARSEGDLSLETAKDVAAGKSPGMASKRIDPETLNEISQAKDVNASGKIAGIKGKITINDNNRPVRQKEILKSIINSKIPTIIFEAGRFGNFGRWNRRGKIVKGVFIPIPKLGAKYFKTKDGTLIKENSKEYRKAVEDGNFLPGRGGLYYGVKDPAYIKARDAAKKNDKSYPNLKKPKRVNMINAFTEAGQAQSKANMDTLETMANVLAKAVADGTMTKENAALFIASSYQATTGLIKIAAPFKYRSKIFEYGLSGKQRKGDKYREEHNPPASVIGSNLIWAITNNKVSEIMPSIRKNFNQTQLSKKDDEKIDNAKLDSTLPIGTTILDNPVTRIAASGINLNSIVNVETGKTLAEENGVGVETKFENNLEVYTKQNELILKLNSNKDFTEAEAKKQIDQFVKVAPSIAKASKRNNSNLPFKFSETPTNKTTIQTAATADKALDIARDPDAPIKKIRVFDFDDTLAKTKSDVLFTMPDGTEGKLNAEKFASDGGALLSEGAVFDFSEFNKVTEGKKGPLFKVAQTIAAKRGTEDVFVLTARAPESQLAIYEFLKSQGLDIPLKNITGLGNSTGDAKARWIVDKAADGYNDFYFADDAPQNVKAVRDALNVIDVKSKTQIAKESKRLDLDKDFNDIIENKTGIGSDKTYSRVKAQVAGASKGKFNFFIPPSAEDFVGLLYSTLGKGDVGDAQMAWYKSHLLNPFARAMENLANDRANMMQDFRGLKKSLGIVPKNLRKKIKDSNFTKEQAVRAYIWDKQGMEIPGISQKDQKDLVDFVNADAELVVFGDQLIEIGKGDAYAAPDAGWVAGTIDTDFIKALNTTKRSKYLETWQQNVDQIFSEANLNKLEAAYGANYREAMVDILKRMKTGKNTSSGSDRLAARFTDWLTNSVGAIMFFNTRSAVLQTISAVNFINFSDNNVLKAGQAFANQPQYWSDFKKLFNSPFLLDRRSGLKLNVNEADIAAMAKGPGNSARNVIAGILKAGFLPTQIADSFAIASGGASFYRNRIKALQKEGLTEAEAEEVAFRDFREIAEESQQSSRPDKISQQQAGPLGRVVLAFANTPAQYARLIKKAASDLKNGRGDAKTNISKIIYYGVAQNVLFSALQQALFAIAFDDEEEEEKKNEKYFNIVNGMSDSILRGIGVGGAVVSVVKNTALRLAKEADKKSPKYQDAVVKGVLQISPPVSSKVGKLQSAGRSFSWNQEEMRTRGWSIDNPAYLASANVISAATNVPLDRAVKKITNIVDAGNEDIEYYKRVALALGWSAWELGIDKKEGKVAPPKTNMDKLYDLNKKEQIDSLLSLGLSKKQIKLLKKEEDRVKAILDPKSIKKIKVSKRDSLFGLNKKDQIQALERLGLNKKEIKALRLESDRVEAIINKQKQEN